MPFWAKELGKSEIVSLQASKRGGEIAYNIRDDGKAVLYAVI